ncbi:uncharacterized protein [Chiloscyllium punctatum]|uniref:uncharacterized protein n=1 Tax=Chiloscyllium punctatum TaxID=137246 RepID=UPI003B63C40C
MSSQSQPLYDCLHRPGGLRAGGRRWRGRGRRQRGLPQRPVRKHEGPQVFQDRSLGLLPLPVPPARPGLRLPRRRAGPLRAQGRGSGLRVRPVPAFDREEEPREAAGPQHPALRPSEGLSFDPPALPGGALRPDQHAPGPRIGANLPASAVRLYKGPLPVTSSATVSAVGGDRSAAGCKGKKLLNKDTVEYRLRRERNNIAVRKAGQGPNVGTWRSSRKPSSTSARTRGCAPRSNSSPRNWRPSAESSGNSRGWPHPSEALAGVGGGSGWW